MNRDEIEMILSQDSSSLLKMAMKEWVRDNSQQANITITSRAVTADKKEDDTTEIDEATFKQQVTTLLEKNKHKIRKKICDDLKYCQKIIKNKLSIELYVLIADLFLTIVAIPVAVIIWMIQSNILSRFCECSDSG